MKTSQRINRTILLILLFITYAALIQPHGTDMYQVDLAELCAHLGPTADQDGHICAAATDQQRAQDSHAINGLE